MKQNSMSLLTREGNALQLWMPEQLADYDNCQRRWGQGTVQITLQPRRKNLLKIDYRRL